MEAATATHEGRLLDPTPFDLPVPKIDGHKADKLAVQVSGSVELDFRNPDDLDFINALKIGDEITVTVSATVTRKGFGYSPGKEDEAGSTGYTVGIKVHSVDR